jgi:hypothetical protein
VSLDIPDAPPTTTTTTSVAPPKPPGNTTVHAVSTESGASPYSMKPPKGHIWLYVTANGAPAKGASFFFENVSDSKSLEAFVDSLGKLDFVVQGGARYRLLHLSEKYQKFEMSGLKDGDSYAIKLQPYPRNEGLVEFRYNNCTIPDIGRINISTSYSSSSSSRYIYISPSSSRVKITSSGSYSSNSRDTFYMTDGRSCILRSGDIQYEVTAMDHNDRWYLLYKKLDAPR